MAASKKKTPRKTILQEFQDFAVQGNVVDLMVGFVVGVGFKDLVTSLVDNIIMPPISILTGRINFSDLYINLSKQSFNTLAEAEAAGAPVLKYGEFFTQLLNFIIIAFVIFIIVRELNKIRQKKNSKKD